jgi:hypothetical protein
MMSPERRLAVRYLKPFSLTLVAAAASLFGAQALAQNAAPPSAEAPADTAPRESVTEELIRLLSEHNALSKQDAEKLIGRLRAEQAPAAAPTPAVPATAGEPKNRVRVFYLPEDQKQKIRDELKQEVIETARTENWAAPNSFPSWAKRIKFDGDFRLREEFDLFDSNNDPFFINYQAINGGSPFNVAAPTPEQPLPPLLNTTEDRSLLRVRARLGISAQIADELSMNLRLATGNTTNPVSTNQTLGNDFNKLSFVVDRAYLSYKPEPGLVVMGGRMPSPFRATELMWDEDLNFDGIAASYLEADGGIEPFVNAGAFSVQNTAFDFPSTSPVKESSRDRWLLALQIGAEGVPMERLSISGALAYYQFLNMRAEPSSDCYAPTTGFSCDSDDSRPAFMQKGNTLFATRNLLLKNADDPQYQYFGLASRFRIADFSGRIDWKLRTSQHLIFDVEYAHNFGFDKSEVEGLGPVNNYAAASTAGGVGAYAGGADAWLAQLKIGRPRLAERGDWNLRGGYRRLESDAVVDAFTDSDFHLGGTNAKGFYFGGSVGFTDNAWLSAQYFSATEVSGPPLAIDVLQLDVNARF